MHHNFYANNDHNTNTMSPRKGPRSPKTKAKLATKASAQTMSIQQHETFRRKMLLQDAASLVKDERIRNGGRL